MADGLDAMRPSLRTDRPTPARMYDYYLGTRVGIRNVICIALTTALCEC
jgi:hypothetical protein